jgi:hypothetical protein
MAAILDLVSNLTFSADQVRTLNELFMEAVLDAPVLTQYHTFENGIRNDREIGILPGTLGLLLKAAQGCDPTDDTLSLTAKKKKWELKRMGLYLKQCYTDLEASFLIFLRNTGTEVSDLTNTQYFAFLTDFIGRELPKEILRHAWFGDKDAANIHHSPAGSITTGVDPDYFNVIDGFWKQLAVIYAADSARKTTISANAQATFATQKSAFATVDAYTALNSVVDNAPLVLKTQPDRMLLVTDSVMVRAKRYLQSVKIAFDTTETINGLQLIKWDGIPMLSMPWWDETIQAYESNGTKYNSPHRIVYTTKSNLKIGLEGQGMFDQIKVFYDAKSENNYIRIKDSMDAKIIMDGLVQVGI